MAVLRAPGGTGRSGTPGVAARPRGSLADLTVVRWVAVLFLVLDSTDSVTSFVASGGGIVVDLLQTLVGLGACACVMWQRWAWAVALSGAVVALMLLNQVVGIEVNLLIVGGLVLAVSLPPRGLAVGLVAVSAFAAALGLALYLERGTGGLLATGVICAMAVLAVLVGVIARRLLGDREAARRSLDRVREENARIRLDERRALGEELQSILTRDFHAMSSTVERHEHCADPVEVRGAIAAVGAQSRATLASVRVVLHVLRSDLDPAPAPARAGRAPAWIDALQSRRTPWVVGVVGLATAGLMTGHAAVAALLPGTPGPGPADAVAVLGALGLSLALWHQRWGLLLCGATVLGALLTPRPSLWVLVPAAALVFAAGRSGRRWAVVAAVAGQVGYLAVVVARYRDGTDTLFGLLEVVGAVALLLGLALGHFDAERSATREHLERLHDAQSKIASEERAGVARELHDVVGHQLSLVSLQALAAEREQDPGALDALLSRIRSALDGGEAEISNLVGALRSAPGADVGAPPVLRPTAVASEVCRRLREHDFDARCTVDPVVDDLDPTTQRTVVRILQESGTNVLRHAPAGSGCTFSATVDGENVHFVARSPAPEDPRAAPASPPGYGLRGIRERVDLTGGTFAAGVRGGSWEVRVSLRT